MGAETTKHKLQLFYKTQPSCYLVFQLGFYNNIQCRCGTVLEVELSERVVDVKTMFLSAHLEHVRLCYYGTVSLLLSHAQAMQTSQRPTVW